MSAISPPSATHATGRALSKRRVCFVGTRTAHFDPTIACIRDVRGFEQAFTNPGWAGFMLGSGQRDLLEVFSEGEHDEGLFPASVVPSGVVIAFAVDDVVTARAELAAAGVEPIGDARIWMVTDWPCLYSR